MRVLAGRAISSQAGESETERESALKLSYEKDGFLTLEDFATKEEVLELRERAETLVQGFNPETISIFSTKEQEKTMNGASNFDARQYFLDSASEISFFFEEGAFDEEGKLASFA